MSIALRLIVDGAASGPVNMARDEALLESVGASAPATLRLYAWETPTLSLGYFQHFAEIVDQSPHIAALPVVRRTTGGGAILHDLELTYALVVPADHEWLRPNATHLYEVAHAVILSAAGTQARLFGATDESRAQRGPFFCFARRHALDVVIGPDKLAGSAQRRTRDAVLQHGSLILDSRYADQPCATWSAHGGPADVARAADQIRAHFERTWSVTFHVDGYSRAESARMVELKAKYENAKWTRRA